MIGTVSQQIIGIVASVVMYAEYPLTGQDWILVSIQALLSAAQYFRSGTLKKTWRTTLTQMIIHSRSNSQTAIFLGTDKRVTITTNWSEFRNLAKIYEGDICAFRCEVTAKRRLVLIVHRL